MSRNIKVAAVALALAGGVYLGGAAPAGASNMGFKLERSFDLVRSGAGGPLQNRYYFSEPLFNGLGDVADGAATTLSKCVGDANGPAAGDGIVDSFDELCDKWTARANPATAGNLSIGYWNTATCSPVTHSVSFGLGGRLSFSGTRFDLNREIAYVAIVGVPNGATYNPQNRVVIVGSHDPSYTGFPLVAPTTCGAAAQKMAWINFPYHSMYTTSNNILCGLEVVDWVDLTDTRGNPGPDGNPDTCWQDTNGDKIFQAGEPLTGIYDGVRGIAVNYWDNTPTGNRAISRTVAPGLGGRLSWGGVNFNLVPGEGYIVNMNAGQNSTWRSPHY